MTALSFEVFPPKSIDAGFRLWDTVQALTPLEPRFFSVTYGAGGSTQDLTHEAAQTLRRSSGLPVAAHLTCVGATREKVLQTADKFANAGITDIVALRGDPVDGTEFKQVDGGFANSIELVEALADTGRFTIRVGAYPESHADAGDTAQNIAWLKAKIDAGATEAITQFFFEAETFLRFRDDCVKAGITARIVPGILPVGNWASIKKFASQCGADVPVTLAQGFENAARDGNADLFALAHCTEMCDELRGEGVDSLHFYTLNRPDLTREACRALGLIPAAAIRNVA